LITKKEILEQPQKHKIVAARYSDLARPLIDLINHTNPKSIDFVGCGTSYFLAMGCSMQLERLSRGKIRSSFYSGSEIMLGLKRPAKNSLLVGLSRSGSSSETILALQKGRSIGNTTASITCEPGSEMRGVSDISVELDFINEEAIVMTKSFTSMAFFVSALARELFVPEHLDDYLLAIPESSSITLENSRKLINGYYIFDINHFVFLGYEEYFAASMEGLIKVTESSLIEADCYQTLEYRHGPKSKVRRETLAVISVNPLATNEELSVAKEIDLLGGKSIIISGEHMPEFDQINTFYHGKDFGDWFLRVIPLHC
jgi:glucosamine--fructose-6-phosphate aminotransferase (isomerizing)